MDNNIGEILRKWDNAKKKMDILESKIKKYKLEVTREMNSRGVEKLSEGGYTVSRRRNTRTYMSKDGTPTHIWKEYSTRCSYDSYHLVRR